MTFAPLQPRAAKPKSTGISMSRTTSPRRGDLVTLTFNPDSQEHLFGGSLAGMRVEVLIGRGEDEGLMLLRALKDGTHDGRPTHVGRRLPRGGGKLELRPWDLLGEHVAKPAPCRLEEVNDRGIILRLPDWCQSGRRETRAAKRVGVGLTVQKPAGV